MFPAIYGKHHRATASHPAYRRASTAARRNSISSGSETVFLRAPTSPKSFQRRASLPHAASTLPRAACGARDRACRSAPSARTPRILEPNLANCRIHAASVSDGAITPRNFCSSGLWIASAILASSVTFCGPDSSAKKSPQNPEHFENSRSHG